MAKPKLLVFLLIICNGNSLPFLWHKRFWKSVKNACLTYCAISIGTEKCFWGECVDKLTKKCTPFFQKIQTQPLKKLGEGLFHEAHAIGDTNLVSKGLDTSDYDRQFLSEIVPRLPIKYGINRPICVTKSEKNQYKVISQRIVPLDSRKLDLIVTKYVDTVAHVYNALAEWIRVKTGLVVDDWYVESFKGKSVIHNIALTLTGEPTFFDFDGVRFYEPKSEEVIKKAREALETATGKPEWTAFTNEIREKMGISYWAKENTFSETFSLKFELKIDF